MERKERRWITTLQETCPNPGLHPRLSTVLDQLRTPGVVGVFSFLKQVSAAPLTAVTGLIQIIRDA